MAFPRHLIAPLTLALSLPFASLVACGSSGVGSLPEEAHGGGGPATAAPLHEGGTGVGDSGTHEGAAASSSSGSSSSGSSSSGSSGDAGPFLPDPSSATFTLIETSGSKAAAGTPILGFDPMSNGTTIDVGLLGTKLSILVQPPPAATAGSLAMALDATYTHTADSSPYSLCGMNGEDAYNPCPFTLGQHTLTVTTYSEPDLQGTPYQPPTVFQFTVIDSTADAGDGGD
ncbi:MAG: hypothetical protein ABSE49_26765 [Polyangiaceae bacterium]